MASEAHSTPTGGARRCSDRSPDGRALRALARLWGGVHLSDRHRVTTLHEGVALDLGALGVLCCDLVLTPSGASPSLLSVGLVVLVAGDDRARLCAAAELPECWLLDVERGWTVRLRRPDGGRYRTREMILPGERLAPDRWPTLWVTPLVGPD